MPMCGQGRCLIRVEWKRGKRSNLLCLKYTFQERVRKDNQGCQLPGAPVMPCPSQGCGGSSNVGPATAPPQGSPLKHDPHACPTLVKPAEPLSASYDHRARAVLNNVHPAPGVDSTGVNEALGRENSAAGINPGRLLGGGGPRDKGRCRAFQARETECTEAERLEHLAHREGMSYGRVRVQVSLGRRVE